MSHYIFDLKEIDKTAIALAGGKGAHLGELTRIVGIQVPPGFCVSTEAFKKVIGATPVIDSLLEELSELNAGDAEAIATLSAKIRSAIEAAQIPADIQSGIIQHLVRIGESQPYAIRSSATAEDLPSASFAGQQDTYLNIAGKEAILKHVSKCWASLFTERAVIYRMQNGFDHRHIYLAVIIQQMVDPQASGILFTADPVSSNRRIVSIDASYGLGEALVSGLVSADCYKVKDGKIIDKMIAAKKIAIRAKADSGTETLQLSDIEQQQQTLTDEQILALAQIARTIEAHFGAPQDIEWCLANDIFYIVQSRPITTLFPIPETNDSEKHIFLSVGHQQMMTDPMKPFGLSLWQLTVARPMFKAGARLFVDVAQQLADPAAREPLLKMMGQHDPLMKDALMRILESENFTKLMNNSK